MARYPQLSPSRPPDDGWALLARLALAHKRNDLDEARRILALIVKIYPGCEYALVRQSELPDGAFARILVTPYSEDEMIVAISESTVLLQEGNDFEGRGVLGSWVSREATKLDPEAAEEAVRDMKAAREGGY